MKRICAALLTGLFLLLTACQPTPEEDIVVNKGDGALEAAIAATAGASRCTISISRVDGSTIDLKVRSGG